MLNFYCFFDYENGDVKFFFIFLSASGVRSGHASHALHDQIFRDCMTNFCAMRYIFFNLMRNGAGLE